MIKTNLATRPFYNEGTVRLWLLALAGIVALATIFNVSQILRYSRSDTELALQASHDEAAAADLRAAAVRERASVDARQIAVASAEARQANDLIDRRTFSWTELFNRLEATLPPDVRLTSVRPRLDEKDRRIELVITVIARTVEDADRFQENLRETGAFSEVAPTQEQMNEEGQLEVAMTVKYALAQPAASGQPPPAAGRAGQ